MLNRRNLILKACAAASFPGAAFAGGDIRAQISQLGRPLRVLVPNGSQANLAPVTASFEARYGCPVSLIATDVDNVNALLAIEAVTQDLQIDVALPATFGIPDLVEGGAIRPLDDLAPFDDGQAEEQALYRTGDEFDGRRWGYQTDGDVYLMFYHDSLLRDPAHQAAYEDRFGQPLEIADAWETLDRQMAFFHRPDEGMFGGCLFRTAIYVAWEWWARFHSAGVWPFAPDMEPQISSDAGVAALEAMMASASHLTGSHFGLFDNWARYKRGDVFANIGWGGTQKALNAPGSKMRGRVRPAQLPCGKFDGAKVPMGYFNWGWSYVVTRYSPAPELAHLFSRHAVSGAVSGAAVAEADGFFDPFRKEHYDDPKIVDAYGQPFLTQHRKAMSMAIPDLYLARRNEYFEALSYWLGLALSGDVAPRKALGHVADAWRLTTSRVGHGAQQARWMSLRARYPLALRRHLRDL